MAEKTRRLGLPLTYLTAAKKKLDNPTTAKNNVALVISPSGGRNKAFSLAIVSTHELKSEIKFGLAMKIMPMIKRKTPKETSSE
jgi:hypothetical protein